MREALLLGFWLLGLPLLAGTVAAAGPAHPLAGWRYDRLGPDRFEAAPAVVDGWTARAPLPDGRAHLASAALRGRLYAIGGLRGHDHGPDVAGDDIVVLTPSEDGRSIRAAETGLPGLSGLTDPLDLVENPANGDLYVAELSREPEGPRRIVLLRPRGSGTAP